MSLNLEEGKKNFSTFHLNNTAISELPENVFENITFNQIEIKNAYNLSCIHTHAFTAMNNNLYYFGISNTPLNNLLPDYDLFTAISSMSHLNSLEIKNTSITEIPDNAFKLTSGLQLYLSFVSIESHRLKKIGNHVFEYWPSLFHLSLANNSLNHISENLFNFTKSSLSSKGELSLNLSHNHLNSLSFEMGSFGKLNKTTVLTFISSANDENITCYNEF